jgi:hypothetical protein
VIKPALILSSLVLVPLAARADEAKAAAPTPVATAAPAPEAAPAAAAPASTPTATAQATPGEAAAPEAADAPPATPAPVATVTEAKKEAPALQANVFGSTSYSFNFNRPADHANGLRVFDTSDASARLDVVEVVLQHAATAPGTAGFRVDLTAGSAIPHIAASAGLFRDDMGVAQDFDVQQAYVTYIAKVGDGLRIDAGKFITHMGYEVIEGYDGWNDNYTRSILFGNAIPFTHTGVRLSMPLGSKVTAMLAVVNGWDNVKDNNDKPSLGAQVVITPAPAFTLYLNYIGGPERADSNDLRQVGDVVAIYKATDKLTFSLNGDLGSEAGATMTGGRAGWYGVAAYGKLQATSTLAFTLRGEFFEDSQGVRTRVAQTVYEGTLTPSWQITPSFLVRGDLRLDRSDQKIFTTDTTTAPSKTQVTVAVNVIAVY